MLFLIIAQTNVLTALQKVILKKQANPYKEFSVLKRLPLKNPMFKSNIFFYAFLTVKFFFRSSLEIKGREEG